MVLEAPHTEPNPLPAWPWRVGLMVENRILAAEIASALSEINAESDFRTQPSSELFETISAVERQRPDLLFVELSQVPGSAHEWIDRVRAAGNPLIAAVHSSADPAVMIAALRAGASEFIHLPARPAIFEAMERMGTLLEARRCEVLERGFTSGLLSAKGGCGATTVACHLAVAAGLATGRRVLLADLDHQSPAAHRLFRVKPRRYTADALASARRLSSANWHEFVHPVGDSVDLLAGTGSNGAAGESSPDSWRIDNLFRFVTRHYGRVLADLGRNLNPLNWAFLQSLDELIIVTAPDVLALYQTRQILQTLANRGFEKSRVRLILNRNHMAPEDFWVESIEQMFEIGVMEVVPNDYQTLNNSNRERFEYPSGTAFARTMTRLAGKLAGKSSSQGRVQ